MALESEFRKKAMLLHINELWLSDGPLGFKIRRVSFLISKVSSKKILPKRMSQPRWRYEKRDIAEQYADLLKEYQLNQAKMISENRKM